MFSPTRWMPSPSILSMALWLPWAQTDASASGTKMPAQSWRPQSSSTSPSQLAASTKMATSLRMLLVTTGPRYAIINHYSCWVSTLVSKVCLFTLTSTCHHSGPWVLQPPEKELHLPEECRWGAEASEQEMVREGQLMSINLETVVTGHGCPVSSVLLWLSQWPFKGMHGCVK